MSMNLSYLGYTKCLNRSRKGSGSSCSAVGCNLRAKTNLLSTVKMFKFPTNTERKQKWIAAMRRKDWKPTNYSVLCNRHFISGKPSSDPQHPDYVPSLFSFNTKGIAQGRKRLERYERSLKRGSVLPTTSSSSPAPPNFIMISHRPSRNLQRPQGGGSAHFGNLGSTQSRRLGKSSKDSDDPVYKPTQLSLKNNMGPGHEDQDSIHNTSYSDEEKFECSCCKSVFKSRYYVQKHMKMQHPDQIVQKDKPHKCSKCERSYEELKNLRKHERMKHGAPLTKRQPRLFCHICSVPYATLELLCSHIEENHNIEIERESLEFSDESDFIEWKNNEELESNAAFVKHGKSKLTKVGELSDYYFCKRSGFFKKRGEKYLMKAQGSCKIGGFCTAHMKVKVKKGGEHLVRYIKTHFGHSNDLEHLWLTKAQKDELALKIKNNVPFDDILNEVRSAPLTSLNRIHLLSRKDLYNIRKEYGLENKTKHRIKKAKCDLPITNHRRNVMNKMGELEKRHQDSLSLCDTSVITYQDTFIVPSNTDDDKMYVVMLSNSDCNCKLRCKDCCVCVHNFTCSCDDAKAGNMCKHIHLVVRINKVSEDIEESPSEEA